MRERPDIPDDDIAACLGRHYGLKAASIRFLPLGYDHDASVYEVVAQDGMSYFPKIRSGPIHEPALMVPRLLADIGVPNILAPFRTVTQEQWCALGDYAVVLYPFVRGRSAAGDGMSDCQWVEFGRTLNAVHSSGLAALLGGQVGTETFSLPSGRVVRELQEMIAEGTTFESPTAVRLAELWREHAELIRQIVGRAESLGRRLQAKSFEFVLCHADIHAANILVAEDGRIYLIDWDGPLLAPRERDLFLVVGSKVVREVEPREQELFFQGYGHVEMDPAAMTYYRYERLIEDIGEFGKDIFVRTNLGEETRADAAKFITSFFAPGGDAEYVMSVDRQTGIS